MNFEQKYDIFAEAKAVLNLKSPLETFKPEDIGTFVLAWSDKHALTSVRGILVGFGCDERGEYATVKVWGSGSLCRYTMVAPLPPEMMPTRSIAHEETIWRDPEVKQPGRPL